MLMLLILLTIHMVLRISHTSRYFLYYLHAPSECAACMYLRDGARLVSEVGFGRRLAPAFEQPFQVNLTSLYPSETLVLARTPKAPRRRYVSPDLRQCRTNNVSFSISTDPKLPQLQMKPLWGPKIDLSY